MCLHAPYFKTNTPSGMQMLHMHLLDAQKGLQCVKKATASLGGDGNDK